MARNKIVSITSGLDNPAQPDMGPVAGAIGISIEVSARRAGEDQSVTRKSKASVPRVNTRVFSGLPERPVWSHGETRYWIGSGNSVGVLGAAVTIPDDALCVFSSFEELTEVTSKWSMPLLVNIWNQLPGQRSVTRFENRRIAVQRLWRAIQNLSQERPYSIAGGPDDATRSRPSTPTAAAGSRAESIIALLQAPGGATLAALIEATGWKAHTVRGFLSRTVSKQRGLPLQSFRRDGQRTYALASPSTEEQTKERS